MAALRNRYFTSLTYEKAFVPWEPPSVPPEVDLPDPAYFGPALLEMDRRLSRDGLTFYMTQDLERLPEYGDHVVAIVIGDEFTRVPAYFDRVGAIFKNHPVRPSLSTSVFDEPSWMNLLWLVAYLRTWAYHFPGQARYRRQRRLGHRVAPIWRLPVGVGAPLDVPVKPMAERRADLFFAGSVLHRPGAVSATRERLAPKTLARQSMMRNVERLVSAHPGLVVDLATTQEFVVSIVTDPNDYSRRLADSRVALVPRGTSPDTYRFWEALRCGCVALVDTLPRHARLYDGAPVVQLSTWDDLERVVLPLLDDPGRLDDLHARALEWWRTRASEEAVGRFMAERLDGIRQ